MRINEDFSQKPLYISDINGEHRVIDFRYEPATQIVFNDEPSDDEISAFNRWLRQHRDEYCILYHGTSADIDIISSGLKRTSARTKRSFQSAPGFVYLSVYPGSARTFGEIAYPGKPVSVYGVIVKIKELKPDLDQLRNKRMWGNIDCGDTLADSLVYGHGARIARNIMPYEIKRYDVDENHINEDFIDTIPEDEIRDDELNTSTENWRAYDFCLNIGIDFRLNDATMKSEVMKRFRKLCRAFDSLAIDYYTDGNLYTDVQWVVDEIDAVKISETDLKYDFSGAFTYYDADDMAGFLVFIRKFDNFSQYMKAMWYAYDLFYAFKTYNVCGLYDLHADNIRVSHRGFVGLLKNRNTYNDETIRKEVEGV